jgi:hypothetical protein
MYGTIAKVAVPGDTASYLFILGLISLLSSVET